MSVGREYTATVAQSHSDTFRCVHCHAVKIASVTVSAEGKGWSPLFLTDSGARGQAVGRATIAARRNAWSSVAGARCPACGRYDLRARGMVYARALVPPVGLAIGGGFLAGADGGGTVVRIAGALIGLAIGAWFAHRKLKSALQPVTFADDAKPAS